MFLHRCLQNSEFFSKYFRSYSRRQILWLEDLIIKLNIEGHRRWTVLASIGKQCILAYQNVEAMLHLNTSTSTFPKSMTIDI